MARSDPPVDPGGVTVEAGFTGGHLLHLAAAGCDLNDFYRDAAALGTGLSAVRATVAGPAGHRVVAVVVRPGTGRARGMPTG